MSWSKVEKDIESGPFGLFKWFIVLIIVFCIGGGIFFFFDQASKPINTAVDRIVMKNSFQYKEGMEQRAAILEASITEIDLALQGNPDNRSDLINQKRVLNAQLRAIKINKGEK